MSFATSLERTSSTFVLHFCNITYPYIYSMYSTCNLSKYPCSTIEIYRIICKISIEDLFKKLCKVAPKDLFRICNSQDLIAISPKKVIFVFFCRIP